MKLSNVLKKELCAFEFLITFGAFDIAVAPVFPIMIAISPEVYPGRNIRYRYYYKYDGEDYANNQVHNKMTKGQKGASQNILISNNHQNLGMFDIYFTIISTGR